MSTKKFIDAQHKYFKRAKEELSNGKKTSGWMWFMFPQVDGLSESVLCKRYSIKSRQEALEYMNEPYLWNNYLELCSVLLNLPNSDISEVLGTTDCLKLKSSLTLFYLFCNEDCDVIKALLEKYYAGELCEHTRKTYRRWVLGDKFC